MRDDRRDDRVPVRFMQLMAAAVEPHQGRARDLLRQGDAVLDRKQRVRRAVDDEERRAELAEPALPCLASADPQMVGRAREVAA